MIFFETLKFNAIKAMKCIFQLFSLTLKSIYIARPLTPKQNRKKVVTIILKSQNSVCLHLFCLELSAYIYIFVQTFKFSVWTPISLRCIQFGIFHLLFILNTDSPLFCFKKRSNYELKYVWGLRQYWKNHFERW